MSGPNARANSQRVRIALLTIFSLTAVLSLLSCGRFDGSRPTGESSPTVSIHQSELTHYNEEGKIMWVLWARSVQYFEGLQQTEAQDVEVHFFKPNGEKALIVRAEQLTFYHRSGDLRLRGNLHAYDPKELQFSTDEAYWEEKARLLRSDSHIHVEREDLTLTGQGFQYRPDEGILMIKDARLKLMLKRSP